MIIDSAKSRFRSTVVVLALAALAVAGAVTVLARSTTANAANLAAAVED